MDVGTPVCNAKPSPAGSSRRLPQPGFDEQETLTFLERIGFTIDHVQHFGTYDFLTRFFYPLLIAPRRRQLQHRSFTSGRATAGARCRAMSWMSTAGSSHRSRERRKFTARARRSRSRAQALLTAPGSCGDYCLRSLSERGDFPHVYVAPRSLTYRFSHKGL